MDFKGVIEEEDWKIEESQAAVHILDMLKSIIVKGNEVYPGPHPSQAFYLCKDEYAIELNNTRYLEETLDWCMKRISEDDTYFQKYIERCKSSLDELTSYYHKCSGSLEDEEILDFLKEVKKRVIEIYGYAIVPESLDLITGEEYREKLSGISQEDFSRISEVLSTPTRLTFMEREKKDLLRIIDDYHLYQYIGNPEGLREEIRGNPSLEEEFERHARDFGWIKNSFLKSVSLDKEHFIDEAIELLEDSSKEGLETERRYLECKKENVKREIEKVKEENDIGAESLDFFQLVRDFTILQDLRKEAVMKMIYCTNQVMEEISSNRSVSYEELDRYYLEDFTRLLEEGKKVPAEEIKNRRYVVTYSEHTEDEGIHSEIFSGDKAKEIIEYYRKTREDIGGEVKGLVASKGGEDTVEGKAHKIFDPYEDSEFQEGEILVTGMTRPEFVPVMKKAKAIITNEGGITSHAAITSRELGKPCIIGTEKATELVEDGDLIELDLEEGVVRKI